MNPPPLYPILDTAVLNSRGLPLAGAAGAMLDGGARWLQIRHKGHFSGEVFEAAERVGRLCEDAGATLIIDDRADIAKMLGAAGVHLGQDDLPPAMARGILGEQTIIGFSTHNEAQLLAAAEEPVDYVAMGPVYATASKDRPDPVIGVDGVRAWRPLTRRPVVAIGGITRDNALGVIGAGADSVAVIGDLYPDPLDPQILRQRIEEWQKLLGQK